MKLRSAGHGKRRHETPSGSERGQVQRRHRSPVPDLIQRRVRDDVARMIVGSRGQELLANRRS